MLKQKESSRKRGKSNIRWIDSIKECIGLSLQELRRAVVDITDSLASPGVVANSMAYHTHTKKFTQRTIKRKVSIKER